MRLKYLDRAIQDAAWFRQYYEAVFPKDREKTARSLLTVQRLLQSNPYMGQPVAEFQNVRRFPVARTPFFLISRVSTDRIEVLRLRDSRRGNDD